MSLDGVFVRDGERFVATELGRGPWDPGALHGGAPAALLARVFEQLEPQPDLELARITYDLVRPVPIGPLEVSAGVVRPGRRVMLLEATISTADGTDVVRARALRIRRSDIGDRPADPLPFAGPQEGRANDFETGGHTMFATDALEIRFVQGSFGEPGNATAWFRLRHPIVSGAPITPLQRVAAAGDFGNGIANVLSWEEHVFINPDLTLYLERQPRGEWVGLQSQTRISLGGVGLAESTLWDLEGRIGRATQALLVAPR